MRGRCRSIRANRGTEREIERVAPVLGLHHITSPILIAIFGGFFSLFGLWQLAIALSSRFHAHPRHWGDHGGGRGPRKSRVSIILFSLCFLVGGICAIVNALNTPSVSNQLLPWWIGIIIATFAAALFDMFRDWQARGSPVRGRCAHCGKSLDFQWIRECRCPHCDHTLPND